MHWYDASQRSKRSMNSVRVFSSRGNCTRRFQYELEVRGDSVCVAAAHDYVDD